MGEYEYAILNSEEDWKGVNTWALEAKYLLP